MEIRQLFLFTILSIILMGPVSSQDDYDEDEYYEDDGEYIYEEYEYEYDEDCDDPDDDGICGTEGEEYEDRPMFGEDDSTLVRVDMGNTARLTCTVHSLGSRVISWKRGSDFTTLGKSLMVDDKRMSVTLDQSSSTLTIALVKEQDAGDYACTVAAEEPISRTFTIEIKAPPNVKIIGKPPGGEISKKAGSSVALNCQGEGDPKPQLKWKKLNSKLVMPGGRLELSNIKISEAGTYQCIADNGFGQPAIDSVKLSVKHKPVVFVDEEYVRDEETQEIKALKLTCSVQAFPAATFSKWTRGDQELNLPQERLQLKREGGKLVLEISKPVQTDLGVYTCKATNSEGTMFAVLTNKEMTSLPTSAAPQMMVEKAAITTPSGSDKIFCPVVTTALALILTCLVQSF